MARRLLIIWNSRAGGGSADRNHGGQRLNEVREGLRDRGVEAEIFESPSAEATTDRIAAALRAGEAFDAIVAAGGDHTVRSVAFELLGTEVPLGILPLGTAMNIARSVELPLELGPALDVLASGQPRAIDVGFVGDRPFLEIVSIGLAAQMLEDATQVGAGRFRRVLDLLGRFVRHRRTRVRLDIDGRTVRHRVLTLAIANGPFTGRALAAVPDARIDDGLLDVACYLGFGPLELSRQLAMLVLGLGSGTRSVRYRGRRVRIRTHHPLPIRADSEDLGRTPATIAAAPAALRVLALPPASSLRDRAEGGR